MALYYFDASALVKHYVLEPGSTWVPELIDTRTTDGVSRCNSVFISEASITESAAAFAVLHRTNRMGRQARDRAFVALIKDISTGQFNIIVVVTADFHAAAYLTQRHPLKAYDAVQLAVALRYRRVLSANNLSFTFVCGDSTLLAAAQAEGLPTDNPFDHVLPQDTPPGSVSTGRP